jgi:hypothetical protein
MKTIKQFAAVFLLSISILLGSTLRLSASALKFTTDSIVKILAIGNSFSDDAIEHYLHGLANAGGYQVIIGNLYVGGAPLDLHWRNAEKDSAAYSYRKINVDGKRVVTKDVSISKALADENWDFISFQQASPKSGLPETYQPYLSNLFAYVKQRATNPKVKFVWHQTWAYAAYANLSGFKNYNNDQMTMYKAIMSASKNVKNIVPIQLLVPAGTAIQNARTKLGDVLNRDGYHLDLNVGRYTAACTWYEKLFGKNVIGNTYRPDKLSAEDAEIAQRAAHEAVKKPFKITNIR